MATTEHFYTGNNSTTDYSFTFPYLKTADIKVTLDAIATTEYTLPNSTTVRFNTAPTTGADIHIYRETDVDTAKATFAAGSSIRAVDLNNNEDQALYTLQEVQGQVFKTSDLKDNSITAAKIAADAVGSAQIADNAVTSSELAADSVGSVQIKDNAVGSSEIASSAVGNTQIANNAVTADKIAGDAVGSAQIADSAVGSSEIAADAVGSTQIANNAVTSSKIAGNAVGSAQISDGAVGSSEIAGTSVNTAHLVDGSVNSAKLAADSVGSAQISDGAVGSSEIAADAVGSAQIADGAVGSAAIAADAVGAAQIADGAVGSAALAADSVGSAQISDGAVGSSEIAADAVGSAQISDGAVGSAAIAADAVGAAQIADGAVGSAALAADSVGSAQISDGAVGSSEIAGDAVGSAQISDGAVGSSEIDASAVRSVHIENGTIVNDDINASAAIALSKINITGTGSSSNFLRGDGSWQTAGSSAFTALSDTPAGLGSAGEFLKVNSGASALEFTAAPSGTTDLSKTVSGSGYAINSSSGDNVDLSLADTDNWGLMSDEMFDKLDAIEASADVTDATNVNSAGAVMNSDLATKGQILIGDGSGDPSALAVGTNDYVLTADSGEATGVKWAAAAAGGGIDNAVVFRKTADTTGNALPITDWEKEDGLYLPGEIGTFSDPSSGVFTFPSTGLWYVIAVLKATMGAADSAGVAMQLLATADNGSYWASNSYTKAGGNASQHVSAVTHHLLDIEDTSNDKVKINIAAALGSEITNGDSTQNETTITFIRLGDT